MQTLVLSLGGRLSPAIYSGGFMTWLNIEQVSDYLRCSISTVRRRIRAARKGKSNFPLPRDGNHNRGMWRLEDIEAWQETPPDRPIIESSATKKRRRENIRKQLAKLGVNVGK